MAKRIVKCPSCEQRIRVETETRSFWARAMPDDVGWAVVLVVMWLAIGAIEVSKAWAGKHASDSAATGAP